METGYEALTYEQRMAFKRARDACTEDYDRIQVDLAEAQSEINRHHRDLARVSEITNEALSFPASATVDDLTEALRKVRNIVG